MHREPKTCTERDLTDTSGYTETSIRLDWTRVTLIQIDYTGRTHVIDLTNRKMLVELMEDLQTALNEYIED